MTYKEQLEVTKIYSVAGLLDYKEGLIKKRPFRSPHHTISATALAGGGRFPKPGEISLAHHGVLFLDELAEFKRDTLDIMRQPLEDGKVTISRVNGSCSYPAEFMLVAAMNPCPCGYFPDRSRCRCSVGEIRRYRDRISRPMLDRIDICTEAFAVKFDDLSKAKRERIRRLCVHVSQRQLIVSACAIRMREYYLIRSLRDQDFQNIVILTSKKKNFFVRHLSQWVLVFVQEIGFCVSQEQLPILREVSRLKKHIWQRR